MESLLKNIQIQRPDPSRVMLSITIFAIIIVTLALCLRFYVRLCMIKHVGLDDWMIILAYVLAHCRGRGEAPQADHDRSSS